jgi:regulator of sigma E protease
MLTILATIFVLGVLIFIHELGHFVIAKRVGIRVDRFSLGFPPNIFSRRIGDTEYCIGVIPLGGYVKMAGEQPNEEATGSPDEFMSKSVAQRAAVIFAGPFMNYILAILLLAGIFFFGGRALVDETRVLVGEVTPDGPAALAGLAEGSEIVAINGESVSHFDSLRVRINARVEESVEVTWVYEGDTITKSITTMASPMPNLEGGVDTVGIIGFQQKIIGYERYGFGESIARGFVTTHELVYLTVRFVKQLVTAQVSVKMIGGPLFIAQQSGREAEKGAASLFFFMALLSVNLAVLNILPIPVLDGGHLVFLAIEKIKGSPVSIRARMIAQQVGVVLLLSLILLVTYNDVLRVLG